MDNMDMVMVATLIMGLGVLMVQNLSSASRAARRRRRRWAVRPILRERQRRGQFQLFLEMKNDPEEFFKYTRMDLITYQYLLQIIEKHTRYRYNQGRLSVELKLALTLSYLARGGTVQSVAWAYSIGKTTAQAAINEICDALWTCLAPMVLKPPTEDEWLTIAEGFKSEWQLPMCLGAIDGKHIQLRAPDKSGSLFYNYKHTFSLVLMAVANHRYEFTLIDVGAYGGQSDGGVLSAAKFGPGIIDHNDRRLNLPPDGQLPGTNTWMPHYFVGDEAFPLCYHLMRPFPGRLLSVMKRIFNYRLSRARRIIENCFGILVARWQILQGTLRQSPAGAEKIVLATVVLHNFLMKHNRPTYCPADYVDRDENGRTTNGAHRDEALMTVFRRLGSNVQRRAKQAAIELRDRLATYLSAEGAVEWQERSIGIV